MFNSVSLTSIVSSRPSSVILRTAMPWPEPVKYASIPLLLVSLVSGFLCLRSMYRWLITMRWISGLSFIVAVFLLSVLVRGLTMPSSGSVIQRWLDAVPQVAGTLWNSICRSAMVVARYPDQFHAAYTGLSSQARSSGSPQGETVIANATGDGAEVIALPSEGFPDRSEVSQGRKVLITAQGSILCEMHVLADRPFSANTVVTVIEGPRYRGKEVWWRVENDTASAWCPTGVLADPR